MTSWGHLSPLTARPDPHQNARRIDLGQEPVPRHQNQDTIVIALAVAEGTAPDWVHLLPGGRFDGTANGGSGPWDLRDPRAVISASMAAGRPLVIDYDHQTDFGARPNVGGTARAAGWITEIEARTDGLWAKVEWTKEGADAVAGKAYRYLSPVFMFDKDDKAVSQVLRAALTNNPALTLTAIASQGDPDDMDDLKAIAAKLGLPEKSTADDILAKVAEIQAAAAAADQAPLAAIAKAAGLAEDAKAEDITAAVAGLAEKSTGADPDPAKFVPMEQYQALAGRVTSLETATADEKATAAVDDAIKAGKLVPAQRDWGLAYARKDLDGFNKFVGAQPTIIQSGSTMTIVPGDDGNGGALDAGQMAVCKGLGLDPEDYKKTLAADKGRA